MNIDTLTRLLLLVRPETYRRHGWRGTSGAYVGLHAIMGSAYDHNGLAGSGSVEVTVRRPNDPEGWHNPAFVAPRNSPVYRRMVREWERRHP